jgi:hypothetical protein
LLFDKQSCSVEEEFFGGKFIAEDGLGSGFTNFFTEGFPFLVVIVCDGFGDISEDIFSVDEEVFSNVVSEGFWG